MHVKGCIQASALCQNQRSPSFGCKDPETCLCALEGGGIPHPARKNITWCPWQCRCASAQQQHHFGHVSSGSIVSLLRTRLVYISAVLHGTTCRRWIAVTDQLLVWRYNCLGTIVMLLLMHPREGAVLLFRPIAFFGM